MKVYISDKDVEPQVIAGIRKSESFHINMFIHYTVLPFMAH